MRRRNSWAAHKYVGFAQILACRFFVPKHGKPSILACLITYVMLVLGGTLPFHAETRAVGTRHFGIDSGLAVQHLWGVSGRQRSRTRGPYRRYRRRNRSPPCERC